MRADPTPNAILLESLALILQRMIKDVNPNNQVPDHLVATLTDIPLYMKESYRANLPSFIKLFDLLIQKGEFVKQFMQKLPILHLNRGSQRELAERAAALAVGGLNANAKIVVTAAVVGGAPAEIRMDGAAQYPGTLSRRLTSSLGHSPPTRCARVSYP